eukprot:CAMPEP_0185012532 /NCGR_PEP_ID=MMETSP1098-20130426/98352_1 /TAXON_ID=89044 /ORGANISM="Spumella elongata, Strain CCAP 955/1" /LENGTH=188 /DNA_ID=CAMNT_0027541595 /DNA_START=632 /DNA_END=1198 /DNA_ORIENTATION=-
MENVPWLFVTFGSNTGETVYYSLKAQYRESVGSVVEYSQCIQASCDNCQSDGHSAYVLVVISCLTALTCAFLCGFMIKKPDFTFLKFVAAIFASMSTLMAGIALSLFMGDCQDRLKDYINDANIVDADYHWGSGSVLVATGMCFMFAVAAGMFTMARYGCGAESDAPAAAGAAPQKAQQVPSDELTSI